MALVAFLSACSGSTEPATNLEEKTPEQIYRLAEGMLQEGNAVRAGSTFGEIERLFLVALSHYDRIVDVGRDQGTTFQALQALGATIERYPNSEYAASARLKFDLALNHLAGQEMEIGRYYLKRGHYTAAINRFRAVVEEYQTTSHTAEALHRLVEAYLSLISRARTGMKTVMRC